MTTPQSAIPGSREKFMGVDDKPSAPWMRFFQEVWRRIGGGGSYSLGGQLHNNFTQAGNVGTGEDDLMSFTLPAKLLKNAGDRLEIEAFGTLATNGNNKNIKLYFGSQTIFVTGAVASNAKDWHIRAVVLRTAAATQVMVGHFSGDTVLVTQTADFVAGTQDLTAEVTVKCTGEATSNNDIVQRGLIINYYPVNG